MNGLEKAIASIGFEIVKDLSSGANRSVYVVSYNGDTGVVKVPQSQRPLCDDFYHFSDIDLRLRIMHNLREAQFLKDMEGHPIVPKLFEEFKMPLLPYINLKELTTEGVALFVLKNGIPAIYESFIDGRRFKRGEKISDAQTQQILIDFVKASNNRGYFNFDWGNDGGGIIIDNQGMPHVVDFGTVEKFDDVDSATALRGSLDYLESNLFCNSRPAN